jgi:MazG family protein
VHKESWRLPADWLCRKVLRLCRWVAMNPVSSNTPKNEELAKRKIGERFEDLVALQARLLAPGGCPWDREQTHESLRPFLIEEAYEVLDALETGTREEFAAELGDLLLQVVFHSELAREAGKFDVGDVIDHIHNKLVRRHPHVFGDAKASTSAEVLKSWEQVKAEERKAASPDSAEASQSILSGIPRTLPALLEAYQLTRRASNIGFDWENIDGLFEKLKEETEEIRAAITEKPDSGAGQKVEEEIGDLLFVAVNIARFLGSDPEIALKKANRKFTRRFQWMEQEMTRQGRNLAAAPRTEMEELWDQSKTKA